MSTEHYAGHFHIVPKISAILGNTNTITKLKVVAGALEGKLRRENNEQVGNNYSEPPKPA